MNEQNGGGGGMTYGDLVRVMRVLGFRDVPADGSQRVFEHGATGSMVVLPEFAPTEPLRAHHLAAVRRLAVARGIADSQEFDSLLRRHTVAPAS